MSETYWKLARHNRWLEPDGVPGRIGGRDTDLTGISSSLEAYVKSLYPINGVPAAIATSLNDLKVVLGEGEKNIQDFIEAVSRDIWVRQLRENKR